MEKTVIIRTTVRQGDLSQEKHLPPEIIHEDKMGIDVFNSILPYLSKNGTPHNCMRYCTYSFSFDNGKTFNS